MSSLKEIKARITTSVNTKQITRAMKMVSAAKLKRFQDRTVDLRPYSRSLLKVICEIAQDHEISHPLLTKEEKKENLLMVVIAGDRGLCGGFNSYVNKETLSSYKKFSSEYENVDVVSIGKKSQEFLTKKGVAFEKGLANISNEVTYEMALKTSLEMIVDPEKKYSRVVFVYNSFKSVLSQEVIAETIFPVVTNSLDLDEDEDMVGSFIFEPSPKEILDDLLARHFAIQIYRCLLESTTAEHAARMNAMENATKNATEMIDTLKLSYNKLRQSAITTELSEICGGAEALKG